MKEGLVAVDANRSSSASPAPVTWNSRLLGRVSWTTSRPVTSPSFSSLASSAYSCCGSACQKFATPMSNALASWYPLSSSSSSAASTACRNAIGPPPLSGSPLSSELRLMILNESD